MMESMHGSSEEKQDELQLSEDWNWYWRDVMIEVLRQITLLKLFRTFEKKGKWCSTETIKENATHV